MATGHRAVTYTCLLIPVVEKFSWAIGALRLLSDCKYIYERKEKIPQGIS
jgi:hypothetical protein